MLKKRMWGGGEVRVTFESFRSWRYWLRSSVRCSVFHNCLRGWYYADGHGVAHKNVVLNRLGIRCFLLCGTSVNHSGVGQRICRYVLLRKKKYSVHKLPATIRCFLRSLCPAPLLAYTQSSWLFSVWGYCWPWFMQFSPLMLLGSLQSGSLSRIHTHALLQSLSKFSFPHLLLVLLFFKRFFSPVFLFWHLTWKTVSDDSRPFCTLLNELFL